MKHADLIILHKQVKKDLDKLVQGKRVADVAHVAAAARTIINRYEDLHKKLEDEKNGKKNK